MKPWFLISTVLFFSIQLSAQIELSNELIWSSPDLYSNSTQGFTFSADEQYYYERIEVMDSSKTYQGDIKTSTIEKGLKTNIAAYHVADNSMAFQLMPKARIPKKTLYDFKFSPSNNKCLLAYDKEPIYRYSSRSNFYVFDRKYNDLFPVFEKGKQMYPTFSPDENQLAFVHKNNIYIKNLATKAVKAITDDGAKNKIINGASDWVYEEELELTKAFEWSPSGNYIAYLKFDESQVKEFSMKYHVGQTYPAVETFKYPKVGEENSKVRVYVYNLNTGQTVALELPEDFQSDYYIPRMKWGKNDQLLVYYLNRWQNHLQINSYNIEDNSAPQTIVDEKNEYYLEAEDHLTFLPDGSFVRLSESDGWNHIHHYTSSGAHQSILTSGKYDVTKFYGVDDKRGRIYFQAARIHPSQREVYYYDLNDKKIVALESDAGWNDVSFSPRFTYYEHSYSNINTPKKYFLKGVENDKSTALVTNEKLAKLASEFSAPEFLELEVNDVQLNGFMIKPQDFDPNKKYPLLMYVYGGPNSQQVVDRWKGSYFWWFQLLTQQGFIVACVDGRGTGARGEAFRKSTYLNLGDLESSDQIEAAKYFGKMDFIDNSKIAIFGWSYGGYLSSLSLLKGNNIFAAAIAIAPVTNWKWYDTIYTERYMRRYQDNINGYDQNAPMHYADRLKGDLLLVHGMTDDNVHFQHTAELADALIFHNKQFDTYFYPNRNHGIYGQNARLHLFTKMTNFLNERLNVQP